MVRRGLLYPNHPEFSNTPWGVDAHHLPNFYADQHLAERAFVGDTSRHGIRLQGADQLVALFGVLADFDDGDPIAQLDAVMGVHILSDYLVIIEDLVKLLDTSFKEGLRVTRGFQFGVVHEVVVLAVFKSPVKAIGHLFTTNRAKMLQLFR